MVSLRFTFILPLVFITILCSYLESFSQTNRKFAILQLVEKSVFSDISTLPFHSPLYRYFEQYNTDKDSRIKLLDGTYSKVNEENVRSHLEYKISSTYKSGQYSIIDTMEQFFAFNTSMLQNLGFGMLNSVDHDTWIADVNGRKLKINKVFYSIYFSKNQDFPSNLVPTLGKYLMFSVYSLRDSSLKMDFYENIHDSVLYNQIGSITYKKGSLVTINNKNIYITEYTELLNDEGKKLLLHDFEVSTNLEIDYFYHESSKKYIALKMISLKN